MTLRERLDKLEPRERKLLGALGTVLVLFLIALVPIWLVTVMSGKRTDNAEMSTLIDQIYEARTALADRRAKHDALLARYAKPTPPLAGFIEEACRATSISAAESQDRPETPHGKRFIERSTVVRMHKINLLPLVNTLEKIEQSGYPVSVSRLNIKPRLGEQDTYEVELGVSAFDRKADAPASAGAASSATPAAPEKDQ